MFYSQILFLLCNLREYQSNWFVYSCEAHICFINYLPSTKWQKDNNSNKLVNTAEHTAAEELNKCQ